MHEVLVIYKSLSCIKSLVSFPDLPIRRVNGAGWKCTLQNVKLVNLTQPVKVSAEPDICRSILIFPIWYSQLSKMKQNGKVVFVQLAFPINAHQNAKSKAKWKCTCIPGAVYTSTPAHLPDPPFQVFNSGSETRVRQGLNMHTLVQKVCNHQTG